MNRRTLLLGSGVAVSTVLAGCSSDESADEGNGGSGNGTDTGDEPSESDVDTLRSIGETIDRDEPLFDPDAERYEAAAERTLLTSRSTADSRPSPSSTTAPRISS